MKDEEIQLMWHRIEMEEEYQREQEEIYNAWYEEERLKYEKMIYYRKDRS